VLVNFGSAEAEVAVLRRRVLRVHHTGDGMAWADAIALATTVPAFVIVLRACWRSRNTRHREKP
jgi:hypothetical protein